MRHHKNYQIIIDKGGSYAHLMDALKGKYFKYDTDQPLALNPFLVPIEDGHYRLHEHKSVFLITFLEKLCRGNHGNAFTPIERAVLLEWIAMFYRQISIEVVPNLLGFANWLRHYDQLMAKEDDYQKMRKHFDVDAFLLTIHPFVHGEYKEIFHADENIDISTYPLVAFDMAGIQHNPFLYPIISLLIIELALDQVRRFPNKRKYLYIDEAWSMLSDSMGEFVENMYRTVRKHNGSITIITQGVDEITQAQVGPAVIQNAATQMILPHTDSQQIARIGDVFGFTKHELDLIHSLKTEQTYREIFIKQDDYAKVYAVEVSPHMAAVLSSKPEERNRLTRLIQTKHQHVGAALHQYVEDQLKR